MLTTLILLGLVTASIYALMAIGLVAVYQSSRTFNLAHGALIVLSAYACILIANATGSLPLALGAALFVGVISNILLYLTVFLRLRRHHLSVMLATFGLGLVVMAILNRTVANGDSIALATNPFLSIAPIWLPRSITLADLSALIFAITMLAVLATLASKSMRGLSLRAVADSEDGAACSGINFHSVYLYAFVISGVTAGIGGALIAVRFPSVNNSISLDILIKALAVALLGGMSSYRGVLVGAILIGEAEALSQGYLNGDIAYILVNCLIAGTLIIFPYGVFGGASEQRGGLLGLSSFHWKALTGSRDSDHT